MATVIVTALLFSIGAGLAGWGINQANRWLPDLALRQRLLIGSLTAPVGWLLFIVFVIAATIQQRGPLDIHHHRPLGELWPIAGALLGLFGISWAGGLMRAWIARKGLDSASQDAMAGHPKVLTDLFPLIYFGLLPLIAMIAMVQIWREQGDITTKMKVVLLGAAFSMGFAASLLSSLGLVMLRLKNLPRPTPLRINHIALALTAGPIILGILLDYLARDARAQGIATLFGGVFALGVVAHFLRFRRAMRARGADNDGKPLSN